MSHLKGMNSVSKLMMISFLTQCYLLCDANGNTSNVRPYGVTAKLRKDIKLAQQIENNPINPEEKWINDGKSSEVVIHFDEFSIFLNLSWQNISDYYIDFR